MCNVLKYRKIFENGSVRLRFGCWYFFNLLMFSTVRQWADYVTCVFFTSVCNQNGRVQFQRKCISTCMYTKSANTFQTRLQLKSLLPSVYKVFNRHRQTEQNQIRYGSALFAHEKKKQNYQTILTFQKQTIPIADSIIKFSQQGLKQTHGNSEDTDRRVSSSSLFSKDMYLGTQSSLVTFLCYFNFGISVATIHYWLDFIQYFIA